MKKEWQIAQMNIATALYPADDSRMSEFYSRLDEVKRVGGKQSRLCLAPAI